MTPEISMNGAGAPDLELAYQVLKVRAWQHFVNERLKARAFDVPIHTAFGYETLAVAVVASMRQEDQLILPHRNMAYHFARSPRLEPLVEEYLARPGGVAGGLLGSMNLAQRHLGLAYTSSILGNNVPVACGAALAQVVRGRAGAVYVILGDGAMEEGAFYEGLVFSRSHGLPLILIVENNDQSMSSSIAERRCAIALDALCGAIGIPYHSIAGHDLALYVKQMRQLRQNAALGVGPQCLEAPVTAFNNHAGPTPGWPGDPKSISFKAGLILREDPTDPLFVLRQAVGRSVFEELERQVLASLPSSW